MSSNFFQNLTGFERFEDLEQRQNFTRAPSDWWVVITDVIASTEAIQSGRYRDVNLIGAATLAVLQNVMPGYLFPFAFGGDGASAIIPPEYRADAMRALAGLRDISQTRYQLGLRAGLIEVAELEVLSGPVLVGKHLLADGYPLAVFRGGALAIAEERIKSDIERYQVPDVLTPEANLGSLSCRWEPLDSAHGQILSLLLLDPEGRPTLYGEFLREVDTLLAGGLEMANPVRESAMRYQSLSALFRADRVHRVGRIDALRSVFTTLLSFVLFKLRLFIVSPLLRRYVSRTRAHTDFRKFDDMLRMVIDVTPAQADDIEGLCRAYRQRSGVSYGLHRSQRALMTCYAPALSDGQHVHFIDGENGGYAAAATQLKAQLATSIEARE